MKKAYVIAEIAQGYEGSPKLCEKFIRLAKASGADAVKFQIFQAHELCRRDYQYYQLFKGLEISPVEWCKIVNLATDLGIDFYADIFGLDTLGWMLKTNIKGIKIHCSDIKNYPFLQSVSHFRGTVILAVGGSELEEIEKALAILKNNKVVLMSGFQGEPNYPADVELNKLSILKDRFNCEVGYADHIDANDSALTLVVPVLAYLNGAAYIEKHLTFERNELQLEDYISALNPSEFKQMVKLLGSVSQLNQSREYLMSPREQEYRKNTKKVPVINKDVPAGYVLGPEDLAFLRVGGQKPEILLDYEQIIGKKVVRGLKSEEVILKEFLT